MDRWSPIRSHGQAASDRLVVHLPDGCYKSCWPGGALSALPLDGEGFLPTLPAISVTGPRAVIQIADPRRVGMSPLFPTGQAAPAAQRPTAQSMDAVIYPRPYLPPDDAQRLGQAIEAFFAETRSEEAPWFIGFGISSVGDLLVGEVPKPLIMNCLVFYSFELHRP